MRKLVDTFPKSYTERVFVVRTAIDMNVQRAAEDAIENQLRQFGRDYHATPGRHRGRRSRRRRARDGRRPRLWRQPVQPRRRRLSPARLVVQALCLHHRAAERLQADLDRRRRSGLHRQLVSAELRPLLFRRGDADAGDHPFDQRRSGEAVDRARRQGRIRRPAAPRSWRPRAASASRRRCRIRRRCRSAPTKSPCSSTRSPMRPSPTRARR